MRARIGSVRFSRRVVSGLHRFRQISNRQRLLLGEAAMWLFVARSALLILPFRNIATRLGQLVSPADRSYDQSHDASDEEVALAREIAWAVTRAARHVPFEAKCLPQAIAAKAMLRRRKIPGVIHFGLRNSSKPEKKGLDAHAWLDAVGIEITGYPVARHFTEIARFV